MLMGLNISDNAAVCTSSTLSRKNSRTKLTSEDQKVVHIFEHLQSLLAPSPRPYQHNHKELEVLQIFKNYHGEKIEKIRTIYNKIRSAHPDAGIEDHLEMLIHHDEIKEMMSPELSRACHDAREFIKSQPPEPPSPRLTSSDQEISSLRKRRAQPYMLEAAQKGALLQKTRHSLSKHLESEQIWTLMGSVQDVTIHDGIAYKGRSAEAAEDENMIERLYKLYCDQGVVPSFNLSKLSYSVAHPTSSQTLHHIMLREKELSDEGKQKIYSSMSPENKNKISSWKQDGHDIPYQLIPQFSSVEQQQQFERLASISWEIRNPLNQHWEKTSFNNLQILWANDMLPTSSMIRASYHQHTISDAPQKLSQLLEEVSWKPVKEEAIFRKLASSPLETTRDKSLENIAVKTFIPNLLEFHKLSHNPSLQRAVMSRLTTDSQMTAIMTGVLQFLDLHSNNLGIAPVPNDHFQQFSSLTFSYKDCEGANFEKLLHDFLQGHIPEGTIINFTNVEGEEVSQPLASLPELTEALNVPWQLHLYDTDKVLAEDNNLQVAYLGKLRGHSIPFRSCLLASAWKDEPLDEEILSQIESLGSKMPSLIDFIDRKDAPLKRHLSASSRQKVESLVREKMQHSQHTKSYCKESSHRSEMTIAEVNAQLSESLADYKRNERLWAAIQKDFDKQNPGWRIHKTYNKETIGSIAVHHKLSPSELIELNPHLKHLSEDDEIDAGTELIVRPKLTSKSKVAQKYRQRLARQLCPRLTWKQRQALLNRHEALNDYIKNYRHIAQLNPRELSPASFKKNLLDYINNEQTPLNCQDRENALNVLKTIPLNSPDAIDLLSAIHQKIIFDTKPTYFNLMKAMYPLLADNYLLANNIPGRDLETAAGSIGTHNKPIEDLIRDARIKLPSNHTILSVADRLEAAIKKADKATKPSEQPSFLEWV
ncbi:MAG: LysM peptidoglycan-binding domain-containing protein [Chlamydiota bacterium]